MANQKHLPPEDLPDGPAIPTPSATVLLLRDGPGLEVLMTRRTETAKFMGGAWVFPGGVVELADADDQVPPQAHRQCAIRELFEEAGVEITDADSLVPYARWITPEVVKRRFDTWFFLAPAPLDADAHADGVEMDDAAWFTPTAALKAAEADEMLLYFPTVKQLEPLAKLGSVADALTYAGSLKIEPILPKVVGSGDDTHVALPGDPDY